MALGSSSHPPSGDHTEAQLRTRGTAAVSTTMVLFAINNVAVAAMALSALTTALYRLWIGTVALAVILWLTGRTPDRAVLRAAIPGGIAYAAGVCLMFSAFQTTSLANATIILALQSGLTLTVVGRFFGETVRPGDLVLTAVATLGVVLIVVGGEGGGAGDLKGDAFAALGMVATTAYFVLAKQARVDVPAAEYQLGLLLVAAVATVPAFMLLGEPLTAPTTWDWARLALLAGGGSVGHLGLNWAHRHVPLKATSLLTLAVPVISPALAWVVLDERLSALQSAGAAVTLGTLAAVIVRSVRPPVELPRGAPAH